MCNVLPLSLTGGSPGALAVTPKVAVAPPAGIVTLFCFAHKQIAAWPGTGALALALPSAPVVIDPLPDDVWPLKVKVPVTVTAVLGGKPDSEALAVLPGLTFETETAGW
jgi:hypothetical protein